MQRRLLLSHYNSITLDREIMSLNKRKKIINSVTELEKNLGKKLNLEEIKSFKTKIPKRFIELANAIHLDDPLMKQVLPDVRELSGGDDLDPLNEHGLANKGLIKKYNGRALLIVTEACPMHCRYCFRREFPYKENQMNTDNLIGAIRAINADKSLVEIILSGGDPLSLSDDKLDHLITHINALDHIQTLRIHSRYPIADPQRVNSSLLAALKKFTRKMVFVFHINHPNEIDGEFIDAAVKLKNNDIHLLNQSVLLKGVNDNASTLKELSLMLFDTGITPYYLHLLDEVKGASHFKVETEEAVEIHERLKGLVSGYLVPKLVKEIAGESSKVTIS